MSGCQARSRSHTHEERGALVGSLQTLGTEGEPNGQQPPGFRHLITKG